MAIAKLGRLRQTSTEVPIGSDDRTHHNCFRGRPIRSFQNFGAVPAGGYVTDTPRKNNVESASLNPFEKMRTAGMRNCTFGITVNQWNRDTD